MPSDKCTRCIASCHLSDLLVAVGYMDHGRLYYMKITSMSLSNADQDEVSNEEDTLAAGVGP